MKALEKLRNALSDGFLLVLREDGLEKITLDSGEVGWLGDFADETEAELADGWMELPRDADGMPIKVGDVVYPAKINDGTKYNVVAVGPDYFITGERMCDKWLKRDGWGRAENVSHRRYDQLKELLEDYYHKRRELVNNNSTPGEIGKLTEQCTDGIREFLKEGR